MNNTEAAKVLRANWPDERYSMLREALDLAIAALSVDEAQERERFEAWASHDGRPPKRDGDCYALMTTQLHWAGWLARARGE